MRNMPQIPAAQKQELMTTTFHGYNHNEVILDGELYDTKNLSADQYPTMCLRQKRGITSYDVEGEDSVPLLGVHGREKLTLIRGSDVIYDGQTVRGINVSGAPGMLPKQIVGFGAYVTIWPDKVYFNTTDLTDSGSIERLWSAEDHVTQREDPAQPPIGLPIVQLCRNDGTDYDRTIATGATPPANPDEGDLWIDSRGENDVLRQYSELESDWVEVPTVYVRITADDIGKGLSEYDTVDLTGLTFARYSTPPSPKVIAQLSELNGSHIIYGCNEDYIVIAGMLSKTVTLSTALNADRRVPDMKYIIESNNRLWGCKYDRPQQKQLWTGLGWDISLTLCEKDGTAYDFSEITVSTDEPESPSQDDLWLKKTSATYQCTMFRYTGATADGWEPVQTFVKFTATGIGRYMQAGMKAEIKGIHEPRGGIPDPYVTVAIAELAGLRKVIAAEDDWYIIEGITPENKTHLGENETAQAEVVSAITEENVFVNEIHASKLGDFKNWSSFMGLSTDSWAASVGTDGPFTGAATQQGYPIFFKENCLHRIYGQTPDSFQIQTTMCRGVQEGSGRSVVVVNEAIYYKSRTDVMVYDGNMPQSISEQLGKKEYAEARAGAVDGKLYISMKDRADGKWYQFTYDTKQRIWYKEDELKALMYATVKDELYLINEADNTLVTVNGTEGTAEEELDWTAVFGINGIEYGAGSYGKVRSETRGYRYLSRFDIRMYMEAGGHAELWIEYNSDGQWRRQGEIRGRNLRSFVLPVIPYRCDHLRVKMTGTGDFRIFSISRILEVGGDG